MDDGVRPTILKEIYDIKYSQSNCRRLLKEAGLSYQKPRRSAAKADKDEKEAFYGACPKNVYFAGKYV